MATCNLTKRIPSNQCIGDSLRTINSNFSALEVGVCGVPELVQGQNVNLNLFLDPSSNRTLYEIDVVSSPLFYTNFNWTSDEITHKNVKLSDGTGFSSYVFPYEPSPSAPKPIATINAIANKSGYPELTLFWTASSSDVLSTVFAVNSSSQTYPNNEVLCFYKDEDLNVLYMGGKFSNIEDSPDSVFTPPTKLATISLSSGNTHPVLGKTGAYDRTKMPALFPVIEKGDIRCISTYTKSNGEKLLIFGGNFISNILGRGLFIYDEGAEVYRTFYFNGEVNNVLVDGSDLYVVGQFTWANIGSEPARVSSYERVYCNNFIKIRLENIASINAFDVEFAKNTAATLRDSNFLYSVVRYDNFLHVGGELHVTNDLGELLHKNFVSFYLDGKVVPEWTFIFDKPIYTMLVDNSNLYIGGEFDIASSYDDFYDYTILDRESKIRYYKAAVLDLSNVLAPVLNKNWKPKFNDSVFKFETLTAEYNTELYALGLFTEVNYESVGHVAAISKASNVLGQLSKGVRIPWNVYLNTAPTVYTNALIKDSNTTLYVGGTFTSVNGERRVGFAKVAKPGLAESELDPRTVEFEFGGQIVSTNQNMLFDFSTVERKTVRVFSGPYLSVNKTTFPVLIDSFKGLQRNQLCRFYLKRNGVNDTMQNDVYVLGWTLKFDDVAVLTDVVSYASVPSITLGPVIPPTATPNPTPTAPPNATPVPTPTPSTSQGPTGTMTPTPSFTPTQTPTPSFTPSSTPSPTPTPTVTQTVLPDWITIEASAFVPSENQYEGSAGLVTFTSTITPLSGHDWLYLKQTGAPSSETRSTILSSTTHGEFGLVQYLSMTDRTFGYRRASESYAYTNGPELTATLQDETIIKFDFNTMTVTTEPIQ